jgi:hypothetical protein
MPSFISSSDRAFIRSLALWTVGLTLALNLVAGYGLRHWAWLDKRRELPKFEATVNMQDYLLNYRDCPVTILGSSVVLAVPPTGFERPGICSIALLGQGALLGLATMARIPAAPRFLFVESTFGFRDAAPDLVATYADPGLRALHAWLPLTSAKANWLNMLGKPQYTESKYLYQPPKAWDAWRAAYQPYEEVYVKIYGRPVDDGYRQHLEANLAQTKSLVAAMERRGTMVIFFEAPLDPSLAALPVVSAWRDMMRAGFADHDWVEDKPEKYYTADGMHLVSGSGEAFYELLLSHLPPGIAAAPGTAAR